MVLKILYIVIGFCFDEYFDFMDGFNKIYKIGV